MIEREELSVNYITTCFSRQSVSVGKNIANARQCAAFSACPRLARCQMVPGPITRCCSACHISPGCRLTCWRRWPPPAHDRRFARGQLIFLEGEPCAGLFIVGSGAVKILKLSPQGREQILAQLGPGDTFNEVAVLDGGPNPPVLKPWPIR